jgi:hypothetical protein
VAALIPGPLKKLPREDGIPARERKATLPGVQRSCCRDGYRAAADVEAGFTGTRAGVASATVATDDAAAVDASAGSQQMTRDDTTV